MLLDLKQVPARKMQSIPSVFRDIVQCTMAIATEGASVMKHFSEMPEAVDFIASQAWLSPDEPVAYNVNFAAKPAPHRRIGPSQALREIAGILRRTRFSRHRLN